jgi:filamentous hemagglutinin family protein
MRMKRLSLILLGATALTTPALAQQLPTAPTVAAGTVNIATPTPGDMTITQGTHNAIVNWQSFSIGIGGTVHVNQPNVNAALLNRVTGASPSTIAGQLTGTGQVFVVNPNGIAITSTGVVETAGFAASTLGISNQDFLARNYVFKGDGSSAAVSNAGEITIAPGGYAALLGGRVSNSGSIVAPFGKIGLGSAEMVTMDLMGEGFLEVAIPSLVPGDDPLVSNSGLLSANGGYIQMTAAAASDLARNVINLSGTAEARSVSGVNGAIVLSGDGGAVKVTGTINTSTAPAQPKPATAIVPIPAARPSYRGGDITITGGAIQLADATIDASGYDGGGDIKIGGDFHGDGRVPTSTRLNVDFLTSIAADALIDGNGGTVVLWSDDYTQFDGSISAKGAGPEGAGGFVEVSGKRVLSMTGDVTTWAPSGKFGTLLLDPWSIIIGVSTINNTGSPNYTPTASGSEIDAVDLGNFLSLGNNVIVSTGLLGSPGAEAGNITVSSPVTWTCTATLTLEGFGTISVSAAITGGGDLFLDAGQDIDVLADIVTTGRIELNAQSIEILNAAIRGAGIVFNSVNAITGSSASVIDSSAEFTVTTTSAAGGIFTNAMPITATGPVSMDLQGNAELDEVTGSSVNIVSAGSVELNEAVQATTGNAVVNADNGILVNGPITALGSASLDSTSTTFMDSDVEVNATVSATTGTVTIEAQRDILVNAGIGAAGAVTLAAGGVTGPIQTVGDILFGALSAGGGAPQPGFVFGTNATLTTTGRVVLDNYDDGINPEVSNYIQSTAGDIIIVAGEFDNLSSATQPPVLRPNSFSNPRFLVYTPTWTNETRGTLVGSNFYGRTYAANPPATIPGGSAFVYSGQPTLTVTVGDLSRMYFGMISGAPTIEPSGLVNGDTFDYATDGTTTATDTTAPGAAVGTYAGALQLLGLSASNAGYILNVVDGDITVTPAPLTITASDITKVYGDTYVFNGTEFVPVGLLGGDTISSIMLTSFGAMATAPVGGGDPYLINVSDAAGANLGNYAVTYVPGRMFVTPRALTITADDLVKLYSLMLSLEGTEFTTAGLVNGDSVDLVALSTLGGASDATFGAYPIAVGDAAGAGLANYAITYVPGTLYVVPPASESGAHLGGDPNNPTGGNPPDILTSLVTEPDDLVEVIGLEVTPGEAENSLQLVEQASAQFGEEIAECERQLEMNGDEGAYLSCTGDALDRYADALENPLIKLPPELKATVTVIRQTAERVRAAASSPNRQEAVREARAAVGELVDFVREQTALVRAVDPETEAILQQQGAVMTQALEELDLQLVGAVEI